MTAPDIERRLADFYAAEAPLRAPDRVLDAALQAINSTSQRPALIRLPWRFQHVNRFAALAVSAGAVMAVGALALAILFGGRPSNIGTDVSPSPSPLPSAAAGTPAPAAAGRLALSERFTSDIHGISVSYPAGWTAVPAILPWNGTELPSQDSGVADIINEREADSPFLAVASRPLVESGDAWVEAQIAEFTDSCDVVTEPVTIDGRAGTIVGSCETDGRPMLALVSEELSLRADRGYLIYLYRIHDLEWFKDILSTVSLEPAAAVDPIDGSAFRHPFAVWMPVGEGWEAAPIENEAYAEFRIPGSGAGGEVSAVGVILRAIDGGRLAAETCSETSDPLVLQDGPETVRDYLDLVRGVTLSGESETTVDGIRALEAFVEWDPTSPLACPEPLHLFAQQEGVEEEEVLTQVPPEVGVRVTLFDIGDEHVVMWTWAETPEWYDVADELIDAIDFVETP